MEPLRIALAGAGSIAHKAYLPLLRTWPGIQIVGIYSRREETVERVCRDWEIPFGTTDLDALIEQRPQAVLVLTHTLVHYDQARRLIAAGLDVYIEKPATEAASLTRELAGQAAAHGLIFMVGFNRRYAPLYRQAKELFTGRHVQMCVLEKHRPSAFHVSLYNNYLDDTIHQIDLMRYYCGEVEPLNTTFEMKAGKLVGAASTVGLANGGIGILQTSLAAGAWQEKAVLHGDGLTVEVNAFRELRVRRGLSVEVFGQDRPGRWLPELEERGFKGEIAHFLDCVSTRRPPVQDGFDAALTQDLVEKLVITAGEPAVMIPYESPAG